MTLTQKDIEFDYHGKQADQVNLRLTRDYLKEFRESTIEALSSTDMTDAEVKAAYERNANTNAFTDADESKLDGIETGAEVNNISDVNATDLTDGGDTSLHNHDSNNDTKYLQADYSSNPSYVGILDNAGSSTGYVRATSSGIIPYSSNSSNGVGGIGTAGWPFSAMFMITLGAASRHVATAYIDLINNSFSVAGNISVTGTVDGRDIATDGNTLDDAVLETDTSTADMDFVIDEDDMASDSATKVPTQQSVKKYVDDNSGGGGTNTSVTKTSDYAILDNDGYSVIYVSTGSSTRWITLPEAANNTDREITIIKIDSGSGYAFIVGHGSTAEMMNYHGVQQSNIYAELQSAGLKLKCNGTEWIVIGVLGGELDDIGGTLEFVYKKFYSGTTANSGATSITHGLPDVDKFVSMRCLVGSRTTTKKYRAYDYAQTSSTISSWSFYVDTATVIKIATAGTDTKLAPYRLTVEYYI